MPRKRRGHDLRASSASLRHRPRGLRVGSAQTLREEATPEGIAGGRGGLQLPGASKPRMVLRHRKGSESPSPLLGNKPRVRALKASIAPGPPISWALGGHLASLGGFPVTRERRVQSKGGRGHAPAPTRGCRPRSAINGPRAGRALTWTPTIQRAVRVGWGGAQREGAPPHPGAQGSRKAHNKGALRCV